MVVDSTKGSLERLPSSTEPVVLTRKKRTRRTPKSSPAEADSCSSCHVYISGGGEIDDPPHATLSVRPDRAAPGQLLQLSASAGDDFGVLRVRFFRVSTTGSVELGSVSNEPFVLSTTMPADARDEIDFFVKVTDNGGNTRDSDRVGVEVTTP